MSEPTPRDREILAQLYADDGDRSEFEIMAAYREEIEKAERERVLAPLQDALEFALEQESPRDLMMECEGALHAVRTFRNPEEADRG